MLATFISCRYIFKSKSARVALIISILAMMLSCCSFIVVSAVMNGMHKNLIRQFITLEGDASIYGNGLNESLADSIEELDGVETVVMTLDKEAMILHQGNAKGVIIRGVSKPPPYIKHSEDKLQSVFLGHDLAIRMGIKPGDSFSVMALIDGTLERKNLTFSNTLTTPFKVYDNNFIFMDLADLQDQFGLGNKIDKMQVYGEEEAIDKIKENRGLIVEKWFDGNPALQSAINFEKWGMNVVLFFVLVIASFGITSSTLLLFRERRKDVALINMLGGSKKLILSIFSLIGLMIGVAGGILGIILGISISLSLGTVINLIETTFRLQIVDWRFHGLETLPVDIRFEEVAFVFLITVFLSFCASLYTAIMALKSPHHQFLGVK